MAVAPARLEPLSSELFPDLTSDTARLLLAAALEQFAAQGFFATTTRKIAERAGMSPASVYIHYKTKADLVFAIARSGHLSALSAVEQALQSAPGRPLERVGAFLKAFARWHAAHQMLSRVSQTEFRVLKGKELQEIVQLRRRFDEDLRREVQRGVDERTFDVSDLNGTVTALLSLSIDLVRWYEPRPGREPDDIAVLYADLGLRMLGVDTATAASVTRTPPEP